MSEGGAAGSKGGGGAASVGITKGETFVSGGSSTFINADRDGGFVAKLPSAKDRSSASDRPSANKSSLAAVLLLQHQQTSGNGAQQGGSANGTGRMVVTGFPALV